MIARLRDRLARLLGARVPALQVGALCVDDTGRVLLVTSRDTRRWIIPKGWPMPGRSLAQAALQEAWEEAGVRGRAEERRLGRYRYDKRQPQGFSIPVDVQVFLIRVEGLADDYPERGQRNREWLTPVEAAARVAEPRLARLIRRLAA
ncbi:MAG TPA: NUDIX hydrolase [Paracoccus sp. (in: a-proteobacteria)]|nr:NUDIX hydrolase [Paracoccus sp. (in: a-proteobacteria)]